MEQGRAPIMQAVQSHPVHTESYLERGKAGTGGGVIRSPYKPADPAENQSIITLCCHLNV